MIYFQRQSSTKAYFVTSSIIGFLSTNFIIYYGHKVLKKVIPNQKVSAKTRAMQRQFTKTLFLQTMNALWFGFVPYTINIIFSVFKITKYANFCAIIMLLLSWLPAANGITTFYVVKDFRTYLMQLFNCEKIKSILSSSSNTQNSTNTQNNSNTATN